MRNLIKYPLNTVLIFLLQYKLEKTKLKYKSLVENKIFVMSSAYANMIKSYEDSIMFLEAQLH